MRRSEAARYARWSAFVALLLAGVTLAVYLNRGWTRHVERKKAPPAAPVDVSRLSNGITFKKVEQNRTIFELQASKSTEFKGQDDNLIEDVVVTIYGKTGERHDVIHTQKCQYGKANGSVVCNGDVQIDLMSAVDAERIAAHPSEARARVTHVQTRAVQFNRVTGVAQTAERVSLEFPSGSGEAVGMEYESEQGTARLLHDVRMKLASPASSAGPKSQGNLQIRPGQEVELRGSSLDFLRDSGTMHLHGPAEAETPTQRMTAGAIALSLDGDLHAQRLVATGGSTNMRPTVVSKGRPEEMKLEAERLTARFAPEGWVSKLEASGSFHAVRKSAAETEDARADSGVLQLWPRISQPEDLMLTGNVHLQTSAAQTADSRVLETTALHMIFRSASKGTSGQLEHAETLAPGSIEWTESQPNQRAPAKTRIQAGRLVLDFGEQGRPRQLEALDNLETRRSVADRPVQIGRAKSGVAHLLPTGGWSELELQGDVRLDEGERSARAEHAVIRRQPETATLTGQAVVRDASTETRAPRIIFTAANGNVQADGGVHSTDLSSKGGAVHLAGAPANISADELHANSKAGTAVYSGHARLWQGDSVLEADTIELLRDSQVLNATGKVRAVFPQTATQGEQAARKSHLWHVTCGVLSYKDKEGTARLEKDVVAQSDEQKMRSPLLDLYFTRVNSADAAARNTAGSRQITRAVGSGGVTVEEGARKATADRGEYNAASGKFVMSGGNPTLYDGSAGTTTGRQLTFFLADDTIVVDSEDGSRTLTKHRVDKQR